MHSIVTLSTSVDPIQPRESLSSPPELKFRPLLKWWSAVATTANCHTGTHHWRPKKFSGWISFLLFVYVCKWVVGKKHCRNSDQHRCGSGLNSSSGGELKLYLDWKRNTNIHAKKQWNSSVASKEVYVITVAVALCVIVSQSNQLSYSALRVLFRDKAKAHRTESSHWCSISQKETTNCCDYLHECQWCLKLYNLYKGKLYSALCLYFSISNACSLCDKFKFIESFFTLFLLVSSSFQCLFLQSSQNGWNLRLSYIKKRQNDT